MTDVTPVLSGSPLLIERVKRPFQRFAKTESSGGIVLLVCTVLALGWANSPWAESYHQLWEITFTIGVPGRGLTLSLHHWINDGLMAVFFLLVGPEIKREMLVGELASARQAALPIAGAIGGVVVPAVIYAALNAGGLGAAGWGIPMATDIAFALGVVALLGPRVPLGLKVFLAALAIVDDIGAVLVIAFFYTESVSVTALGIGAVLLAALALCNVAGVRHTAVYALLGVGLWGAFLASGVHATIAGVLLAMTIPARTRINEDEFLARGRAILDAFEQSCSPATTVLTNDGQQHAIHELEVACEHAQAPLLRMEHGLHGIVAFGIMPLFALANAGVHFGNDLLAGLSLPVTTGVIFGLLIGKPIGIGVAAWLAVRAGLASLPTGARWSSLIGVSCLAGIGFTMSIFIAGLAFPASPELLDSAKTGILIASLSAGLLGWMFLRQGAPVASRPGRGEAPDGATHGPGAGRPSSAG
ncbi:MAG: Na+/H+ antiporter NhaA [Gemmatimonadota bacterium]|nr:Na+/H+ antiporter NhaA [Gemmatimonadota bacterium]